MKGFIITLVILVVLVIGGIGAFAIEPFLPISWQERIAGYQFDLNEEWSPAVPVGAGPAGSPTGPQGLDGTIAASWGLIDSRTGLTVHTRLDPVKIRTGSGNAEFSVNVDRGPIIVFWKTRVTSRLASNFEIFATSETYPALGLGVFGLGPDGSHPLRTLAVKTGENYVLIDESGRFEFTIASSGLDWEVRVGVEPR